MNSSVNGAENDIADIAIVGIDCRFPGASDPAALWNLLMCGEDGISTIPSLRWPANAFHGTAGDAGHMNTREGGFIDNPDAFDCTFFNISPREAEAMDPQQRLMLQTVWRAFEDATLDPRAQAGSRTGVFIGVMGNEWSQLHMTDYAGVTPQLGTGNGYCMIANRISYQFDLKGPSMAIDTACSSSLVATHQACNALRYGECDQAVAAGVNVIMTPALQIFYTQAGLSAPDSRCRPFSSQAQGIGRSEGVGVLILRRLDDALRDGLPIYATIKGGAINQDGRSNGITAPNRWAQRDVVIEAYRRAKVQPEMLAFIEAHGTGTVLGDFIEANALGDVHAVPRSSAQLRPCAIGSIKGNLGHTEGAAGIAGIIKAALALHHGTVPPSRYASSENTQLRLADKGLRLLKMPERLPRGISFAAVSSFGLGGTNGHLVLASAPIFTIKPTPKSALTTSAQLTPGIFTLSAVDVAGLRRNLPQLCNDLAFESAACLAQLAWSSNQVKASGRHRLALVATDKAQALAQLQAAISDQTQFEQLIGTAGSLKSGWLFTGQGAQYSGMSHALHRHCDAYRRALAEVDMAMNVHLGCSVSSIIFAEDERIHQTSFAQPALFALAYALGRTLLDAGLRPDWMVGHSIGEYAAAALAGVFDLNDACRLIVARGQLMQALPDNGGMLAARCSVDLVEPLLLNEPLLNVAAINALDRVVISGELTALARLEQRLALANVTTSRLTVSRAFHSVLMEPMLKQFRQLAEQISYRPAQIAIYSTLYGRVLGVGSAAKSAAESTVKLGAESTSELMDANYWVQHILQPVRFTEAMLSALKTGPSHLVEIGPQRGLLNLVSRLSGAEKCTLLLPCAGPEAHGSELFDTVASLYRDGAEVQWNALYPEDQRVRRRLSPYLFSDDQRFWSRNNVTDNAVSITDEHRAAQSTKHHLLNDAAIEIMAVQPVITKPNSAATLLAKPQSIPTCLQAELMAMIADVGGYRPEKMMAQTRLAEDLGYDSLTAIQLKGRIEQRWKQPLDVGVFFFKLKTVGELLAFLQQKLEQNATAFTSASTSKLTETN